MPFTTNPLETLLGGLAQGIDQKSGCYSSSVSVYDTAWVSMIDKTINGHKVPLFPECFHFLLERQLPNGGWEAPSGGIDNLICSMAALLALETRSAKCDTILQEELESRCSKGRAALQQMLRKVNIGSFERVGLGLIVPTMLRMLEEHGVHLDIPDYDAVMNMHNEKLKRLCPIFEDREGTSLAHFSEAFSGKANFDRVKKHLSPDGDMLASPASTAAYLIFATAWENSAEGYIRLVLEKTALGPDRGGVLQNFPIMIFEISLSLTLLLDAGYTRIDIGRNLLGKIKRHLFSAFERGNQVFGLTPNQLPDVDDTAAGFSALQQMGETVNLEPLFDFETTTHFAVFKGEKFFSFTANCNVLLCLLRSRDVAFYTTKVLKITALLTRLCLENRITDKWHKSKLYPIMLSTQALVKFSLRANKRQFIMTLVPSILICERIPMALLGNIKFILDKQRVDGSWGGMYELTAYALLALSSLCQIRWTPRIESDIQLAIVRGRKFLVSSRRHWTRPEYLWVDKIVYAITNLTLAYCLAATKCTEDGVKAEDCQDLLGSFDSWTEELRICYIELFHS